jgi:hypothetical protein
MRHTQQLLDYLATQEDAVLTYNASNMILAVHSDASYPLANPRHKVEQADISSYPVTHLYHQTTERC